MSKKSKIQSEKVADKNSPDVENDLPLTMHNYKLMLIGFALIVVGFALMIGGKSPSPEEFNYEMFSFRRITLAPILVLAGFAFEIYAIMKKPKAK